MEMFFCVWIENTYLEKGCLMTAAQTDIVNWYSHMMFHFIITLFSDGLPVSITVSRWEVICIIFKSKHTATFLSSNSFHICLQIYYPICCAGRRLLTCNLVFKQLSVHQIYAQISSELSRIVLCFPGPQTAVLHVQSLNITSKIRSSHTVLAPWTEI